MKYVDKLLYIIILLLVFLKCFAISKYSIQTFSAYGIIILSLGGILFNYKALVNEIILLLTFYFLSLLFSITYIFDYLAVSDFLNSLLFPLIFIISYIYFKKYPKDIKWFKYIGVVAIILAYYNLLRLSLEINLKSTHLLQSNAGNTLVALMPFATLWKNKIIKYGLFILIFLGCLVAIKRSAFVIFIAVMFAYLLLMSKENLYKSIFKYVFLLSFVAVIVLPEIKSAAPLLERMSNSVDDGGSGRDELVKRGIMFLSENNFSDWVIGNGYLGFRQASKLINRNNTCAHNDFVEILYDAGFISYIFFLWILGALFIYGYKLYKSRTEYATDVTSMNHLNIFISFICCNIIFFCANIFVCTFVHFWYYLPMYCLWGAVYSISNNYRYENL